MRKKLETTKDQTEKIHLKDRIRIIREHRIDKEKESRSNKIKKIAEDIKENVNNGGKIWEEKRRITRKKEVKYPIKCENNKTIQKIIREYKNYHEKPLKIRKAKSEEGKEAKNQAEEKLKKSNSRSRNRNKRNNNSENGGDSNKRNEK